MSHLTRRTIAILGSALLAVLLAGSIASSALYKNQRVSLVAELRESEAQLKRLRRELSNERARALRAPFGDFGGHCLNRAAALRVASATTEIARLMDASSASGETSLRLMDIERLMRTGDSGDLHRVLGAIAELSDRSQRVSLLRELLTSRRRDHRHWALQYLKDSGKPEAVELALAVLNDGLSYSEKSLAIEALSNANYDDLDESSRRSLENAAHSEDWETRAGAVIGIHGGDRSVTKPEIRAIVQELSAALTSNDGSDRARATMWLGKLGASELLPMLAATLSDESSYVREEAVKAVAQYGDVSAQYLITASEDPITAVSERAKDALALWGLSPKEKYQRSLNGN